MGSSTGAQSPIGKSWLKSQKKWGGSIGSLMEKKQVRNLSFGENSPICIKKVINF